MLMLYDCCPIPFYIAYYESVNIHKGMMYASVSLCQIVIYPSDQLIWN
jgi:hypothetical protein